MEDIINYNYNNKLSIEDALNSLKNNNTISTLIISNEKNTLQISLDHDSFNFIINDNYVFNLLNNKIIFDKFIYCDNFNSNNLISPTITNLDNINTSNITTNFIITTLFKLSSSFIDNLTADTIKISTLSIHKVEINECIVNNINATYILAENIYIGDEQSKVFSYNVDKKNNKILSNIIHSNTLLLNNTENIITNDVGGNTGIYFSEGYIKTSNQGDKFIFKLPANNSNSPIITFGQNYDLVLDNDLNVKKINVSGLINVPLITTNTIISENIRTNDIMNNIIDCTEINTDFSFTCVDIISSNIKSLNYKILNYCNSDKLNSSNITSNNINTITITANDISCKSIITNNIKSNYLFNTKNLNALDLNSNSSTINNINKVKNINCSDLTINNNINTSNCISHDIKCNNIDININTNSNDYITDNLTTNNISIGSIVNDNISAVDISAPEINTDYIIANNMKTLNLFANVEINNNTIIIESDINIVDKSFTTLISVLNIDNKVNIIEQYDIVETDKLIFDELIIKGYYDNGLLEINKLTNNEINSIYCNPDIITSIDIYTDIINSIDVLTITLNTTLINSNNIISNNISTVGMISDNIFNNAELNILGSNINIGDIDSYIHIENANIYNYQFVLCVDKLIRINTKNNDIGLNSGINIKNGFIKTNNDGTEFIIKNPSDDIIRKILILDSDENISNFKQNIINYGNSTCEYCNVNIIESNNIKGGIITSNSIFSDNIITDSINCSNNTIIDNYTANTIFISGNTFINTYILDDISVISDNQLVSIDTFKIIVLKNISTFRYDSTCLSSIFISDDGTIDNTVNVLSDTRSIVINNNLLSVNTLYSYTIKSIISANHLFNNLYPNNLICDNIRSTSITSHDNIITKMSCKNLNGTDITMPDGTFKILNTNTLNVTNLIDQISIIINIFFCNFVYITNLLETYNFTGNNFSTIKLICGNIYINNLIYLNNSIINRLNTRILILNKDSTFELADIDTINTNHITLRSILTISSNTEMNIETNNLHSLDLICNNITISGNLNTNIINTSDLNTTNITSINLDNVTLNSNLINCNQQTTEILYVSTNTFLNNVNIKNILSCFNIKGDHLITDNITSSNIFTENMTCTNILNTNRNIALNYISTAINSKIVNNVETINDKIICNTLQSNILNSNIFDCNNMIITNYSIIFKDIRAPDVWCNIVETDNINSTKVTSISFDANNINTLLLNSAIDIISDNFTVSDITCENYVGNDIFSNTIICIKLTSLTLYSHDLKCNNLLNVDKIISTNMTTSTVFNNTILTTLIKSDIYDIKQNMTSRNTLTSDNIDCSILDSFNITTYDLTCDKKIDNNSTYKDLRVANNSDFNNNFSTFITSNNIITLFNEHNNVSAVSFVVVDNDLHSSDIEILDGFSRYTDIDTAYLNLTYWSIFLLNDELMIRIHKTPPTINFNDVSDVIIIKDIYNIYDNLNISNTPTGYPIKIPLEYPSSAIIKNSIDEIIDCPDGIIDASYPPDTYTVIFTIYDIFYNSNIKSFTFKIPTAYNDFIIDLDFNINDVPITYNTPNTTFSTNPIKYETGYGNSNIYWSYLQGTMTNHIIFPPLVESPNSSFTLSNPGPTFTAFTLSKTFIDTVNLNEDWFCAFKLKRFSGGSMSFMIYFDSREYYDLSKSGWYYDPPGVTYVSAGQDSVNGNNGAKFVLDLGANNIRPSGIINSFDVSGSGVILNNGSINWVNSSDVLNQFNNGMYMTISKNENLKTFSLKLYKNDGTLYVSIILNVITTNSYNRLPFHLYHNTGKFKYYDGFIWSKSNMEINDIKTLFPSGNLF